MYLGELSGVPEWKGWDGPISQTAVDARWKEIGQTGPAPLVPPHLIGLYLLPTRGPRMFGRTAKGGWYPPFSKAESKATADFLNFWGKVAVDPYRKQSGISKIAGGILQVASVALPAMSYFTAVADAGNAAFAYGGQGGDVKLAERVLAPAYAAEEAKEDAAAKAEFDAQMNALKTLAPPIALPVVTTLAPVTAQPVNLTKKPVATARPGWTNAEMATAALIGGALLLGALRR